MRSRRVQVWCKCNRVQHGQQGIKECNLTELMPDTNIISIWIKHIAQPDGWIIPYDLFTSSQCWTFLFYWRHVSSFLHRKDTVSGCDPGYLTYLTGKVRKGGWIRQSECRSQREGNICPHTHTALLSQLHLASHLAVWILRGYIWNLLHLSAEQSGVNVIEVSVEGWISLHPLCWESSCLAGTGSEADALFMKQTRHLNSVRSGIFLSAGLQNKIYSLLSQTISLYFGVFSYFPHTNQRSRGSWWLRGLFCTSWVEMRSSCWVVCYFQLSRLPLLPSHFPKHCFFFNCLACFLTCSSVAASGRGLRKPLNDQLQDSPQPARWHH